MTSTVAASRPPFTTTAMPERLTSDELMKLSPDEIIKYMIDCVGYSVTFSCVANSTNEFVEARDGSPLDAFREESGTCDSEKECTLEDSFDEDTFSD